MIEIPLIQRMNGGDYIYQFACPLCPSQHGPNYDQKTVEGLAYQHLTRDHKIFPERVELKLTAPAYCPDTFAIGDQLRRCSLEVHDEGDHEAWYNSPLGGRIRLRWSRFPK